MQELEQALVSQAPFLPDQHLQAGQYELPPLHIDGIPTPVDKMTQAQLRAFIPEMLKFSTGRSKPGWGKPEYRPIWWPMDVPWANVRSDVRNEDMKKKVYRIIIACISTRNHSYCVYVVFQQHASCLFLDILYYTCIQYL